MAALFCDCLPWYTLVREPKCTPPPVLYTTSTHKYIRHKRRSRRKRPNVSVTSRPRRRGDGQQWAVGVADLNMVQTAHARADLADDGCKRPRRGRQGAAGGRCGVATARVLRASSTAINGRSFDSRVWPSHSTERVPAVHCDSHRIVL
eukprot:9453873-Pyramimonas_sp.AAC.1